MNCLSDININLPFKMDLSKYIYQKVVTKYILNSLIVKEKYNNNKTRYLAITRGRGQNSDIFYINHEKEVIPITFNEISNRGELCMAFYDTY